MLDSDQLSIFLPLQLSPPSLPSSDLFSLRRQGLKLWQSYFSTRAATVDFALEVARHRLGFLPPMHKVETLKNIS